MALERVKVIKGNNEPLDEMEKQVSQALLDLEVNSDLKASLRELHVTAVKEVRKYCFNKYICSFLDLILLIRSLRGALVELNFRFWSLVL